ncbi:MAG: Rieske (2Fe-2S) domain protein [Modestobacter sp.]|jgi:3-phenylpropionate/trans-cinnamate dioxygenase ferredoxin subunit|nr:Rieske (2Fe-2S) domain protein [Modestobacter sp.]
MTEAAEADWIKVATTRAFAEDSAVQVEVEGQPVCLARSRGRLYGLLAECSHGEVLLSEGDVEDGTAECYMHGSQFDLASGRPLTPPAVHPVPTFAVRVDGEDVYVSVEPLPKADP